MKQNMQQRREKCRADFDLIHYEWIWSWIVGFL